MSEIINKISSFFHYVQELIDLIKDFFSSLVGILSGAVNYIKLYLQVLPLQFYIIISIIVVVCLIYVFLGRQGNG